MPTINKLPKKEKSTFHNDTPMRELRQKAYQSTQWKKLRLCYLKEHPLCAECLRNGKITPADSVHHSKSPFNNGQIYWELLLDYNNLESICAECHGIIHSKGEKGKTNEEIIKELEELLNGTVENN